MTNAQLQHLIKGGNITRFTTFAAAQEQSERQTYYTGVLLGTDGRYWVAATPRVARRLIAAGYQQAN